MVTVAHRRPALSAFHDRRESGRLLARELERDGAARRSGPNELAIVPGATHLFEEPGALEQVASLTAAWLTKHLVPAARSAGSSG